MKSTLFLLLLIFSLPVQAQSFEWASQAHWSDVDEGKYVCADNSGNLYVVGSYKSGSTHPEPNSRGGNFSKYNSLGQLLWSKTAQWENLRICIDSYNNPVITGSDSSGYFVEHYNSQGTLIHRNLLLPKINVTYDAIIRGITFDSFGNYFITGLFWHDTISFNTFTLQNPTSRAYLFLAKFDVNGNCLWAKQSFDGSISTHLNLTLDSQGNIYLGGDFLNTLTIENITISTGVNKSGFISKFDSLGNVQWLQKFGGVAIGDRFVTYLSTDNLGNIYATGSFWKTLTLQDTTFTINGESWEDAFLIKLNSLGVILWAKQVGGDGKDFIQGVKTNSDGDVLISGSFTGTAYFDNLSLSNSGFLEPFVAKYDSEGNAKWVLQTGGNGAGEGLTVDQSDNVYVTGSFGGPMSFGNHSLTGIPNSMFLTKISDNDIINIEARTIISSFKIYPNPPGTLINISCSELTCSKLHLNIKNNLGQTVYSVSELNIGSEYNKSIDLSQQPKGIYFIEIIADDKRMVRKVILQ
jgi:hypothetical protein